MYGLQKFFSNGAKPILIDRPKLSDRKRVRLERLVTAVIDFVEQSKDANEIAQIELSASIIVRDYFRLYRRKDVWPYYKRIIAATQERLGYLHPAAEEYVIS